jgi:hypothetical protein
MSSHALRSDNEQIEVIFARPFLPTARYLDPVTPGQALLSRAKG